MELPTDFTPLLPWFEAHRRPMPWRENPTPYRVWVSEIMLQQTQIATAWNYFLRFTDCFPTVERLARADLEQVLKLWEGLGYYSRARNLHRAAQVVVRDLGGNLPTTAAELERLPGIGAYTAAAIASICHGESVAVVDGNVARVCARLGLLKANFSKLPARRRLAETLRPSVVASGDAGAFNQAMMELGETVCLAHGGARCEACPLSGECLAWAKGVCADYPVSKPRTALPVRHEVGVIVGDGERVALVRREGNGLLGGLYELPAVAAGRNWRKRFADAYFPLSEVRRLGAVRHRFSHFELRLDVYRGEGGGERVAWKLKPVSTAHRKALGLLPSRENG